MGRRSIPTRPRFMTTVISVLLMLAGMGAIGVSVASQQRAPHVEMSADVASSPPNLMSHGNHSETAGDLRAHARRAPHRNDAASTLPRSKPSRLRIPSIGVSSSLQHLGQATDGSLEVPAPGPRYNDAAWYRHSPTPGELGPAILLGHVDSAAEGPSVFFRLGELKPGDGVVVERADGSTARFTVDEVKRYPKEKFPTDLVYGDIDHAGLRILTCGGAFDDSTGHYLDNIVVFASLDEPGS